MVKSPLEYFEGQNFDATAPQNEAVSDSEQAFIQKYMGLDVGEALARVPLVTGDPEAAALVSQEPSLYQSLREAESVQLVGFYVGQQLFALPTLAIQEVIRKEPIWVLPLAPRHVSGVINLRGHITPLIKLRELLDAPLADGREDAFTIICRSQGMQFGIEIERLQSMYRIEQRELNWDAETSIGANVDFITGMFVYEEKIIPVVSVERIVESMLK